MGVAGFVYAHNQSILDNPSLDQTNLIPIGSVGNKTSLIVEPTNKASEKSAVNKVIDSNELVNQINQRRSEGGLTPVSVDSRLNIAAINRAGDMVAKNYISNVPNDIIGNPLKFLEETGYIYNYAAALLYTGVPGVTTSSDVITAFMGSKNKGEILNSLHTGVGIGIVTGEIAKKEQSVVVIYFASPSRYNTSFTNYIDPNAYKLDPSTYKYDVPDFTYKPSEVTASTETYEIKSPTIQYSGGSNCHIAAFYCDLYSD